MAKVAFRRNRYVLDYYENGKRHVETMPKGTSLKEAKTALREIETAVSKGVYVSAKKIPAFGEVCQEWLEHKKTKVRASTWGSYKNYVKNHFGIFDNLKINALTTAKIEAFISDKEKSELPEIRFHDLRHTFASLMLMNGENVKVIQTQLGHSTPMQTLNTYSHLMKNSNQDVADRLENTVFKESGYKTVTKAG